MRGYVRLSVACLRTAYSLKNLLFDRLEIAIVMGIFVDDLSAVASDESGDCIGLMTCIMLHSMSTMCLMYSTYL